MCINSPKVQRVKTQNQLSINIKSTLNLKAEDLAQSQELEQEQIKALVKSRQITQVARDLKA